MADSDLDKIFDPNSIALIGASDREGSVGRTLMKNLLRFKGKLYPVNIRKTEILGSRTYQSIDQLPETVDLAIIATPARTVPKILEQCGKAGIVGVIIISAGFKEVGPEGEALEEKVLEIKRKYDLRIVGPNCLGIIRPSNLLNATFTSVAPKPGNIAFISQSGAVGWAILDWATGKNIGFSNFVSVGSMIDVDFGDLIDYFGADPKTRSILMYIEGITNARKFMSAARHFSRTKPILFVKAGKFSESAKAVASHTGSLAGEDEVYEAALKRAGLVRVDEVADLFSSSEVLAMQPLPKGPNLAIITNAGGLGVMATDTLIARQGRLAELSQKTIEKLNSILPHYWSRGNPIDILGDADADRYKAVVEACIDDENVDGLLIIYAAIGDPVELAKTLVETLKNRSQHSKTVLASFMGSEKEGEVNQILTRNSIPIYSTPEQAVKAYTYMYQYRRNLELLYETPEELHADMALPKRPLLAMLKNAAIENREILTEDEAKAVLAYCNLPVVNTQVARTAEEAAIIASDIGYPVVLKVLSPHITHKTDAGGVMLDIGSETELRRAFDLIMKQVENYNPQADVMGVTVQPMVKKKGFEVIIGAKKDPIFGPVILFGMGGVSVELFRDAAVGLPPLNQTLARRIMEETKVYKLLKGYRNLPPANIKLLEEIMVRFSQMLVDFPEIKEVDINPLSIDEKEALALDARVMIEKELSSATTDPYEHLVISPYPGKYEDFFKLRNGQKVLLRPIKPEDEPLWLDMLQSFSDQLDSPKFLQTIRDMPHEVRIRYCNIDYDREIAIVAETAEDGRRKIIGVVRLIIKPNKKAGEVAFVVAEPWRGSGLGTKMLNYMIEICRDRGLNLVCSLAFSDDSHAIKLLKKLGFSIKRLENREARGVLNLRK